MFRFAEVSGPQRVKKLITCPLRRRLALGMFGWRIAYLRTELCLWRHVEIGTGARGLLGPSGLPGPREFL